MSKLITKMKLLTAAAVLIMLCLGACKHAPSRPKYLVPYGFEGTVRVVFDDDCRIADRLKNNTTSPLGADYGIVLLNCKLTDDDKNNNEFYAIDKDGKKTRISSALALKAAVSGMPVIYVAGVRVTASAYKAVVPTSKRVTVIGGYIDFTFHSINQPQTASSSSPQPKNWQRFTQLMSCPVNRE